MSLRASIYKVDPSQAKCDSGDLAFLGNLLDLKAAGATTTSRQVDLSSSDPQILTLSSAVSSGDHLCLVGVIGSGQFFFSPVPASVAVTPRISFSNPPQALSKSISVKGGAVKDKVTIYAFDASYIPKASSLSADGGKPCEAIDLPNAAATIASEVPLNGSSPQSIPLVNALSTGEQLCIVDQPSPSDPEFSDFVTVFNPKLSEPAIDDPLESDSASVIITGAPGASVSLYEFAPATPVVNCKSSIEAGDQRPLQFAPQGSSSGGNSFSTPLASTEGPYTLTLSAPPDAGSQVCLEETLAAADGGRVLYSSQPKTVTDSNNPYPRVRTFYTVGFMINNQNGSNPGNGSSTGAEYLDAGVAFSSRVENGNGRWGYSTSLSGRFSAADLSLQAVPRQLPHGMKGPLTAWITPH